MFFSAMLLSVRGISGPHGRLPGFMVIMKLHPTHIKAGIWVLCLEMVHIIDSVTEKKKNVHNDFLG